MKKEDLIEKVQECFPNATKKDAKACVEAIFDGVFGALADGDRAYIPGFGSFTVIERAARDGVNPRTGKKMKIAAMKTPKFTPAKALRDAVKAA
jgi:DNA-binding protein HU-beta